MISLLIWSNSTTASKYLISPGLDQVCLDPGASVSSETVDESYVDLDSSVTTSAAVSVSITSWTGMMDLFLFFKEEFDGDHILVKFSQ